MEGRGKERRMEGQKGRGEGGEMGEEGSGKERERVSPPNENLGYDPADSCWHLCSKHKCGAIGEGKAD